jgi:hypothetical protein
MAGAWGKPCQPKHFLALGLHLLFYIFSAEPNPNHSYPNQAAPSI